MIECSKGLSTCRSIVRVSPSIWTARYSATRRALRLATIRAIAASDPMTHCLLGSKLLVLMGCRTAARRRWHLGGQRGTVGLLFSLQPFRYSGVPGAGRCRLRLRAGFGHTGSAFGPICCGRAHDPLAEARTPRFAL